MVGNKTEFNLPPSHLGLPMLRIVFLGIAPSGLQFSLSSNVIPNGLLPPSHLGLPMLRIVFLGIDPYPKPFKIKLRLLLAFLTLIRSIKQACFAASH